jgi:hypothetical protein
MTWHLNLPGVEVKLHVWIGARVPAAAAAPNAIAPRHIRHVAQKQRLQNRPLSQATCNKLCATVSSDYPVPQNFAMKIRQRGEEHLWEMGMLGKENVNERGH